MVLDHPGGPECLLVRLWPLSCAEERPVAWAVISLVASRSFSPFYILASLCISYTVLLRGTILFFFLLP